MTMPHDPCPYCGSHMGIEEYEHAEGKKVVYEEGDDDE